MKGQNDYLMRQNGLMLVKKMLTIIEKMFFSGIFRFKKSQGQEKNAIAWGQLCNTTKRKAKLLKPWLPISSERRMVLQLEKNMMVRKW